MSRQYPLKGKTVIVTRAHDQSRPFISCLKELGAETLCFPVIEIRPVNKDSLTRAVKEITKYHWLIFTSINAVEIFFRSFLEYNAGTKIPAALKVAAVGRKTAESLEKYGLSPALVPDDFTAEGLLKSFSAYNINGKNILLPVASLAMDKLPEKLRFLGAAVDAIPVYDTLMPETYDLEALKAVEAGYITFTSSSTVTNFHRIISENNYTLPEAVKPVSIGPVTSETVRQLFRTEPLEASEYTVDGIVEEMVKDAKKPAG